MSYKGLSKIVWYNHPFHFRQPHNARTRHSMNEKTLGFCLFVLGCGLIFLRIKYSNSNQLLEFTDKEGRETSAMFRHKN